MITQCDQARIVYVVMAATACAFAGASNRCTKHVPGRASSKTHMRKSCQLPNFLSSSRPQRSSPRAQDLLDMKASMRWKQNCSASASMAQLQTPKDVLQSVILRNSGPCKSNLSDVRNSTVRYNRRMSAKKAYSQQHAVGNKEYTGRSPEGMVYFVTYRQGQLWHGQWPSASPHTWRYRQKSCTCMYAPVPRPGDLQTQDHNVIRTEVVIQ